MKGKESVHERDMKGKESVRDCCSTWPVGIPAGGGKGTASPPWMMTPAPVGMTDILALLTGIPEAPPVLLGIWEEAAAVLGGCCDAAPVPIGI